MVHLVPSEAADDAAAAEPNPQASLSASSNFEAVDTLGLDTPHESAPARESAPAAQPQAVAPASGLLGRRLLYGVAGSGAAACVLLGVSLALLGGPDVEVAKAPAPAPMAEIDAPQPPAVAERSAASATNQTAAPESASRVVDEPEHNQPSETMLPPVPPVEPDEPTETRAVVETDPATEQEQAEREIRRPAVDPLDFDPASLDLVMLRGDRKAEAGTTSHGEAANVGPAPGERLSAPVDPKQQRVASLDRRLADHAEDQRVWVERGETAFEAHRPVDLGRRLSDRVPELYLPRARLGDAVRLWSELSGVPVTIDPSALARAGVSTGTKLTLKGQNVSLGELLLEGLKPLRLTYAEQQGQVVLCLENGQEPRSVIKDYADLAHADAAALGRLASIFALSPREAQTLSVEGASLRLGSTIAAYHDLTIFCERLRIARGMPQRTKYPVGLLPVTPSLANLSVPLERRTTFTFVRPTPLADIFNHWRSAAGIEVLVDWTSAASAKISPLTLVRCSVRDQPWRVALDGVLGQLGLGWRAVDGRSIQVASLEDAQHSLRGLEFYPLDGAAAGDEIADKLARELDASSPGAAIQFDEPSRVLLVRAGGAGQQLVYDWLTARKLLRAGP